MPLVEPPLPELFRLVELPPVKIWFAEFPDVSLRLMNKLTGELCLADVSNLRLAKEPVVDALLRRNGRDTPTVLEPPAAELRTAGVPDDNWLVPLLRETWVVAGRPKEVELDVRLVELD
ncbi:hypothetical protein Pcinc_027225 [Petrolisthes cinctipes]|uniref:Uncharacterized protein n=1 Tax=Petrolisthes cinctipes TaxID=88211 RepID=A0AAE1F5K6_PETCI|nr:hypothetical protein Pcinc_027225 [Petrolisthes cinctipes]